VENILALCDTFLFLTQGNSSRRVRNCIATATYRCCGWNGKCMCQTISCFQNDVEQTCVYNFGPQFPMSCLVVVAYTFRQKKTQRCCCFLCCVVVVPGSPSGRRWGYDFCILGSLVRIVLPSVTKLVPFTGYINISSQEHSLLLIVKASQLSGIYYDRFVQKNASQQEYRYRERTKNVFQIVQKKVDVEAS
jgi:hypothetical protein